MAGFEGFIWSDVQILRHGADNLEFLTVPWDKAKVAITSQLELLENFEVNRYDQGENENAYEIKESNRLSNLALIPEDMGDKKAKS